MKKLILMGLTIAVIAAVSTSFVACSGDGGVVADASEELVIVELKDAPYSDCVLAVKKGDALIKDKINEVINDWSAVSGTATSETTYEMYMQYYAKIYAYGTATGYSALKTTWDTDGEAGVLNYYIPMSNMTSTQANPPYCFFDADKSIKGVEIAIVKEAAERLDFTLNIVTPTFDTLGNAGWTASTMLEEKLSTDAGYACAGGGLIKTTSNNEFCDYSEVYDQITNGLVSKGGKYDSIMNLEGLRIAVVKDGANEYMMTQALGKGLAGCGLMHNEKCFLNNISVVTYESYGSEACLRAVLRGEVDAAFVPYFSVYCYMFKNMAHNA